ncbi:MAG: elongation factor G [Anaerolineales bacterium]|nr:elongation factor G [Anaerolineales bacterium]MBS3752588.1 elongation factor G [Anaerolineales bacterium]
MKEYPTKSIRNVAFASHSGSGKTMLSEALLYFTGAITRMGEINNGTTVSDYQEEEKRREISIATSVIPVEYQDYKINILDTPGYTDFVGEVISAMRVVESVVIPVDSVAGAEVGTELAWSYADKFGLPRIVVINMMDRDNANFQKALNSMREVSDRRLIPLQLPWGEKGDFKGVFDLLNKKALKGAGEEALDIPAEYLEEVEAAGMEAIEAAAEGNDELLMKYLEGEELTKEEVLSGLKEGIKAGSFVPVLVTSATSQIGLVPLLESMISLLPSPEEAPPAVAEGPQGEEELPASDAGPLAAYVWKTTADPYVGKMTYFHVYSGVINEDSRVWNQDMDEEERLGNISIMRGNDHLEVPTVHAGDIAAVPKLNVTSTGHTLGEKEHPISLPVPEYPNAPFRVAVNPKTQADSAKLSPTLTRLCEEDMTLSWRQDTTTKETILEGMGDQHIDVAIRKAKTLFQTELETTVPKVPYQETITKTGAAQYRHKKQSGGAGQFAEVHMRVEPLQEEEFEFVNEVFGGAISRNYMPAIEKGVKSVMEDGVLAGYPVVNVKVAVFDGKEHPVDSKPVAFEICAKQVFKMAVKQAGPALLEPIMSAKVTVPEDNMGDILGDLNTRRARVQGMDTSGARSVVSAQVPLAEMQRYTTDLRSMTGGRGIFEMEFSHYQQLPANLANEVIQDSQKEEK